MKKYLSILLLIGLILCTGAGRKAEPIEAKSGELNIEQFEDYEKRYIGEEVQVCSTSSTKSYMDYRAITSRSSAQYKYIREYMLVDENFVVKKELFDVKTEAKARKNSWNALNKQSNNNLFRGNSSYTR